MAVFYKFMVGLREHPWVQSSTIVLFTEMNTGKEAGYFAEYAQTFPNVEVVRQQGDERYGEYSHSRD